MGIFPFPFHLGFFGLGESGGGSGFLSMPFVGVALGFGV